MTQLSKDESSAVGERMATDHELQAAIKAFEGAVCRQDTARLVAAQDAAHSALQNHLDAIASMFAVTMRRHGLK